MPRETTLTNFDFDHGQLPGSLELAFLGDTLYDLKVREALVRRGGRVRQMHSDAVRRVCAHAQARAFSLIEPMLTPEEQAVARRARNARQTTPRNADPGEYHHATALEALVGYLYLTGQTARMDEILTAAIDMEAE